MNQKSSFTYYETTQFYWFIFFLFQIMIGEDKLLKFSGVAVGEACTIVIRGATSQIVDEGERSLHDALCVLSATVKETRTVYGGGMKTRNM
jgi:chaperonin GroEL (HSP60 family)